MRAKQSREARARRARHQDEPHPLRGGCKHALEGDHDHDDLILWLAYREANAMIP
jgi:hypothetical protein